MDKPISINRHIIFQIVILVLIVAMPLNFFIHSELENIHFKDEKALKLYAQKVANKIYKFSNSNEKEFFYPRSNIYKSAIYNEFDKPIFSLLANNFKDAKETMQIKNSKAYIKYPIKENIFNGKYLIISKNVNYSSLIVNVIVILMVITLLVLLSTFSIIKQSSLPYKRLNQYLENFMKDAMHEMKTPMGVILLNLDGLDATFSNNKMVQRAKSALKNMIVVYEDLEFFVKNKQIQHPKKNIDFSKFCKERVAFFKDLLEQKKINTILNIEDNIYIDFSPLELSRILDNTLSNAIKYSKSSTSIEIELKRDKDKIILSIKDQGKGIKDTKKIFNRYYRGDRISGGFGIGLNIVKQICDNNGVKIEVLSKVGEGSEFRYIFPFVPTFQVGMHTL